MVVHPQKKSGKKSENTDIGCLEYRQKYFEVGRSVDGVSGLIPATINGRSVFKYMRSITNTIKIQTFMSSTGEYQLQKLIWLAPYQKSEWVHSPSG